jgi:hypothetical protein
MKQSFEGSISRRGTFSEISPMNQLSEQNTDVRTDRRENGAARQVFLFSGHMIDAADRTQPRFPPDKEPLAKAAIETVLDQLGAGANDVAISSAACGGDLLFVEACVQRGLHVEIYLPFVEEEFLQKSVNFAGDRWREKFLWVKERVRDWHIMSHELPSLRNGEDPYSRVNLWMLDRAAAYGSRNIRFICLWDGKASDGPGGTKHLHDAVEQCAGRVYVLDTAKL